MSGVLRGGGLIALLLWPAGAMLMAQERAPAQAPSRQHAAMSAEQLDTLVAPVALYPDSLLSEVLVASTYPLEIVEANQWLQQNGNLSGRQLVDAARQQNWDGSIQALVVFPDVLGRLASDARWTTDLGDAFLAQQADVMRAVQRLRARAQQEGRLNSDAQQTVTNEWQGDQPAVDIQPANPEVVYVPDYNPEGIWGAPEYGDYPELYYPDSFGFYPGVYIGGFFGGLGWGDWGWAANWFACNVFLRPFFFLHSGFGGGSHGGAIWAHNPAHRLGVAYPNRTLANRLQGAAAGSGRLAGTRAAQSGGAENGGWQHFGQRETAGFQNGSRSYGGTSAGFSSASHAAGGGEWSRFSAANSYGGYRSSFGGASGYRPSASYRTYGGYGGGRSTPAYHVSRSYGGGGFHSAGPSFHGGGGGFHGGSSFHGGGGGGRGGGSHGGGHRR
jgi:hypothetical protein